MRNTNPVCKRLALVYRLLIESDVSVLDDKVSGDAGATDALGDTPGFGGVLHINEHRSHKPFFNCIDVQLLVVIVIKLCPTSQVSDWPPDNKKSVVGSLNKIFQLNNIHFLEYKKTMVTSWAMLNYVKMCAEPKSQYKSQPIQHENYT